MQSFNNYSVSSINPDGTVNIIHNGLIVTRVKASNPSIGNSIGTVDFALGKESFQQSKAPKSSAVPTNQDSRFRYVVTPDDDFEIVSIKPSGEDISCVHFNQKLLILLNDEVPSGYTKSNFEVEFTDAALGYSGNGLVSDYSDVTKTLTVDTPKNLPSEGNIGSIKVSLDSGEEDDIPFTEYSLTSERETFITISFAPDKGLTVSNNYPNPPANGDISKYNWTLFTQYWPTEVVISGYKDYVFNFHRVNISGVPTPYTQCPYQYEIRIYKKLAGGSSIQIPLTDPIFGNPSGSISDIPDLIAYSGEYSVSDGIGGPSGTSYYAFIDLMSEEALTLKWQVKTAGGFPTTYIGSSNHSTLDMFMNDSYNSIVAANVGYNLNPVGSYNGQPINGFIGQIPFNNVQIGPDKTLSDIFGWPNDGTYYMGSYGELIGCGKTIDVKDILKSPDTSTFKELTFTLQFTDSNTAIFIYINDTLYAVSGCPYYRNIPIGIETLEVQQAKYLGNKYALDFSIVDNSIQIDNVNVVTDTLDYFSFNQVLNVKVGYKDTGNPVNVKIKASRYVRFIGINSSDSGYAPYQQNIGGVVNIAKIIAISDKDSNLVEPSIHNSFITHFGDIPNGVPVDKISFNY